MADEKDKSWADKVAKEREADQDKDRTKSVGDQFAKEQTDKRKN